MDTLKKTSEKIATDRKACIADAAIPILALQGRHAITHRKLAKAAKVSLAATTYYYSSKADIIAEASRRLLDVYTAAINRAVQSTLEGRRKEKNFSQFAWHLLMAALGRHRVLTMAWCEIMLEAGRDTNSRIIARNWFDVAERAWTEVAGKLGEPDPAAAARSAIDSVTGLMFMTIALDLNQDLLEAVFLHRADPFKVWEPINSNSDVEHKDATPSATAQRTQEKIIEAAISLLEDEGPGGVTYRALAKRSGLAVSAPVYHFKSINKVLAIAQAKLFEQSKGRYRTVFSEFDRNSLGFDQFLDFTTETFVREVKEFGSVNLRSISIWLEAGRQPELRPIIWSAIVDQAEGWGQQFKYAGINYRKVDSFLGQALFIGRLVRSLAIGEDLTDTAQCYSELEWVIRAIENRSFWI